MEKLKSTNNICGICDGNGYIKITDEEDKKEVNIHHQRDLQYKLCLCLSF